jgi:hypothetical protein
MAHERPSVRSLHEHASGRGWIISLGALGVAAWALYVNHRERSAALRTALYETQIEAYGEIVRSMNALVNNHAPTEAYNAHPEWDEFVHVFQRSAVYLPKSVNVSVTAFVGVVAILAGEDERRVADEDEGRVLDEARAEVLRDPKRTLNRFFYDVFSTMRESLGVDRLSDETYKLVASL